MSAMARSDVTTVMAACLTLLLLALGGSNIVGADARAVGDAKDILKADPNVSVDFVLDYQVIYKQGFVIAGNISELGNWNTHNAPLMNITGVSHWTLNVALTQGTAFEYKPVLVCYDTKDECQWYPGSNLVYVANNDSQIVLYWPGTLVCTNGIDCSNEMQVM